MSAALLERPTAELNHSCTSQCSNPCGASGMVEMPGLDVVVSPEMTATVR